MSDILNKNIMKLQDINYDENMLFNYFNELNEKFCYIQNSNDIYINYKLYKKIISFFSNKIDSDNYMLNYVNNKIEQILINKDSFNIHLDVETLTLLDIDKNKEFIQKISLVLKERFPDKLNKCFIYNASFIFSNLFSIISYLIDKKTQQKIILVKES